MSWAVVTGAGSGIGAVIARQAAAEGYRVACWDVDADAVAAVAAEIGGGAVGARVDVTDEAAVLAALDALDAPPSLVVNNAGIVRFSPLATLPLADWSAVLAVNLTGVFLVARSAAARMTSGGSIVNITSVNGVVAAPNVGAYTAAKAGMVLLTEQMALEWAERGIRVNAVAPGMIHAGMSDPIYADPEVRRLRQERVPLGTLGTAEDIAEAVLFLASDKARYITAQTLAVDGGLTKSVMAALARPPSVYVGGGATT